eukprot:CAMPEP_0196700790 /NCGR_PEP_ID=MMETSP1090-20130531/50028_1 /TAXON_ID=37098 /ORGANISM="Isochrysis sp, Strain CCMP1244" /LENGTH=212 /DNA_ID=CAMNT_0042040543 /DNA_START=52 /DNA_END=686 /DNA_ORIENTATION=-
MAPTAERSPPAAAAACAAAVVSRASARSLSTPTTATLPFSSAICSAVLPSSSRSVMSAARPEQAEHDGGLAVAVGSTHQRGAALAVLSVNLCAVPQQHVDRPLVAAPDGVHQRGDAVHVLLRDARPKAQQLLDDAAAAAVRSHEERGLAAGGLLSHLRPPPQQQLGQPSVALGDSRHEQRETAQRAARPGVRRIDLPAAVEPLQHGRRAASP